MELLPFDPADYLVSEVGIQAYLDDAALDGPDAVADAQEVVARARMRMERLKTERPRKSA